MSVFCWLIQITFCLAFYLIFFYFNRFAQLFQSNFIVNHSLVPHDEAKCNFSFSPFLNMSDAK